MEQRAKAAQNPLSASTKNGEPVLDWATLLFGLLRKDFFGIVLPTVCPCDESSCVMQSIVISIAANEHPIAVYHRKEAKT